MYPLCFPGISSWAQTKHLSVTQVTSQPGKTHRPSHSLPPPYILVWGIVSVYPPTYQHLLTSVKQVENPEVQGLRSVGITGCGTEAKGEQTS